MAQGTTLLKNEQKALPLDATKLDSVAVIGPMLSHSATDELSKYYGPLVSCGNYPFYVGHHKTMIDAIQHYVPAGVSMHCGTSVRDEPSIWTTRSLLLSCVSLIHSRFL